MSFRRCVDASWLDQAEGCQEGVGSVVPIVFVFCAVTLHCIRAPSKRERYWETNPRCPRGQRGGFPYTPKVFIINHSLGVDQEIHPSCRQGVDFGQCHKENINLTRMMFMGSTARIGSLSEYITFINEILITLKTCKEKVKQLNC